MVYKPYYRCRLCGNLHYKDSVDERTANIIMLKIANRDFKDELYRIETCYEIYCTHNCSDGSFGLSDFQGFKVEED